MRLIKARIEGFGKLRDLEIEFGPNITIVFGANEVGKSTLQSFILGVLYGFRVGPRRFHHDRNDRVPWDGSPFRGLLTFLLSDDEPYEVHRDFSRNQGVLYETSTGRRISDKPETWLEDKLGFNRNSFGAALVVRQAEVQEIAEKGSPTKETLREALERLASGLDATAASALEKLKKALGEVGERDHPAFDTPLGRARRELEDAAQRLEEAKRRQAELSETMRRLREVEIELEEMERGGQGLEWAYWTAKAHEIREKLDKLDDFSRQLTGFEEELKGLTSYAGFPIALEPSLERAMGKVAAAESQLDRSNKIQEKERQEWERARKRLDELKFVESLLPDPEGRLASVKAGWEIAKRDTEEVKASCEAERGRFEEAQNEAVLEEARAKRMLSGGLICVGLGAILIATGMAVKGLFPIGGGVLLVGFVLLALWRGGVSKAKAKREIASEINRTIEQRLDGVQRKLYEAEEKAKGVLKALGEEEASSEGFRRAEEQIARWQATMKGEQAAHERYESASKARADAEKQLISAEIEVKTIVAQAGVEDIDEFRRRARLRKECDRISAEVERVRGLIEEVLAGKPREAWEHELAEAEEKRIAIEEVRLNLKGKPVPERGPEDIARELDQVRRRIADLREEKGSMEGALGDWPPLADVEGEWETAAAEFKRLKDYSQELQWAKETLEEAAARFGREISTRLAPRVNELAELVLGGNYEEIAVDSDLTVRVRPRGDGRWREVGMLSTGAREQLFLILRVAAAEALSQAREALPLILDEPFAQYDASRRHSAWNFIFDLSTQLQIVLFTCHENYLDEACRIASHRGWSLNRITVGEFTIADLRPRA